jgi:phosphatidylserine/phosphatidylglycerophosphate/cardiolipin synthase-like enzyme
MLRLFLRDEPIRSLCLVSPFISAMIEMRFGLTAILRKIATERIPTFVVTRTPEEPYQQQAVDLLEQSEWVEIRYNESLHAKVFIAHSKRESQSFALFGSGNLTGRSISTNLEVGMLLDARGDGRPLVEELAYWTHNKLRILPETRLHKPFRPTKR